jgi:hypothetical protein
VIQVTKLTDSSLAAGAVHRHRVALQLRDGFFVPDVDAHRGLEDLEESRGQARGRGDAVGLGAAGRNSVRAATGTWTEDLNAAAVWVLDVLGRHVEFECIVLKG